MIRIKIQPIKEMILITSASNRSNIRSIFFNFFSTFLTSFLDYSIS
nr:MAG TPA: hypothetical protein [Caudoviricetes sp.]